VKACAGGAVQGTGGVLMGVAVAVEPGGCAGKGEEGKVTVAGRVKEKRKRVVLGTGWVATGPPTPIGSIFLPRIR